MEAQSSNFQMAPELLIKNIEEKEKKINYLIKDNKIILDIISAFQYKNMKISEKSVIINFLNQSLKKVPINIGLFFNQKLNQKCLYQIIIHEYIINYEEKEYCDNLRNLFFEIIKNIGLDKSIYQYLISFISDYINKKNILLNENLQGKEIPFDEKIKFNDFNSSHLMSILNLIQTFYESEDKLIHPFNYLYFTGEENNNIIIYNNSHKMDLKDDIYIMMFIKLFNKEYFEKLEIFSLIEIKLNNNISINIKIILENNEPNDEDNTILIPYSSFKINETNQFIVKISQNKNIQILINNNPEKCKEILINQVQINSLILFQQFIGSCSNIILYKNSVSNDFFVPKIFSKESYKNGIYKEELFAPFIKCQISINVDEKYLTDKNILELKDKNISEYSTFFFQNLIAIYIPTRYEVSYENNNNIILADSINNLNAFLSIGTRENNIHSLCNSMKALYSIGSINHLLPIMELITNDDKFKEVDIFNKYIYIISFIFSNLSTYFQLFDKNSQFFYYLSHYLEKIDNGIFNEEFCNQLNALYNIFISHKDDNNYKLFAQQFNNYIFLNENILFKFDLKLRKDIINQIKLSLNDKSRAKEIGIIKIIKILMQYDSYKYNKYCCKEHSQYFNYIDENEISNPEVNVLVEPIIDLIKEIINIYISDFKNVNLSKSNNTNNQINDYNLDKLLDILTFDISPCLQKIILNVFYDLRSKPKQLNHLNKNGKIISVLLFLLKTTLFNDIRILVYDFISIFIIDKNFNTNFPSNSKMINHLGSIVLYIEENILPNFLFMDKKGKNVVVKNLSGELQEEKYKEFFFVDNVKYNYLILSNEQCILNNNYNKSKTEELIMDLYNKVYNNLYQGINVKSNLNILVKLVSKGNAVLSLNFLEKLSNIINSKDIKSNKLKLPTQIISNLNLMHWLLEICFHSYLLENCIKKNEKNEFFYGIIFPENFEEKEIISKLKKILELSNNLIIKIFNNDIYKLDYLLTWSKYYNSIIEEKNKFSLIRDFVEEFIFSKLIDNQKEIYMANISYNKVQQTSLYFYNIIFEYYTFFKIKTSLQYKAPEDLENLYQEINSSFKLNILTELKKEIKEDTKSDIYDIFPKLPFYNFMKKINILFQSLWKEQRTKIKNDKTFYSTYIYHKQNISVYELELLFYSFKEIKDIKIDNIYSIGNTGIPLIYILFHQYTIFFMTNNKNEFKEIIRNFRYFLTLIIISSTSLVVSKNKGKNLNMGERDKEKINWPDEDQYKNIQNKIKLFLFNCFYYLYYKIIEVNKSIKENEINTEKVENLKSIKKYLCDTICYFLKILDCILKEKIKREEEKKKKNIKAMFSAIKKMIITKTEGIELSGAYMFFYEFSTKCLIKLNINNNKKLGENIELLNNTILNTKTFIDDIPIYDIETFLNENSQYNKIYEKIEKSTDMFLENENIKKYLDDNIFEYQKILFPFLKIIFKRKELVGNLIPIYDNSCYCDYKYEKYNSICLMPDYYPINLYERININNINNLNSVLSDEIRLSYIKHYFERYDKITKYYKLKKRLFSFKGLWSKEELFYNKKNYELKYKIFNHLTEDFSKIFITPIIDMKYYLPKFSSFNIKELFRKNNNLISLERIVDLSTDYIEDKNNTILMNENSEKKEIIKNNELNEDNKEIGEEIFSNIISIKKLYYKNVEDLSLEYSEQNEENHYKLLTTYIQKINKVNSADHCSICSCCLVKSSFHIKGIFYNNYTEIGFYGYSKSPFQETEDDVEFDPERKSCFGSVFKSQKNKYDGYYLKIPYNQIAFVLKRRYFFKMTALEIYTLKNKNYYFRFNEKYFKKIFNNLKLQMKSTIEDIQIEYSKIDYKIGFVNNNDNNNLFINTNMLMYKKKDMNLKNLFEKWQNWEISTFKFLMICNIYANRSLNDINQYPVFPWIITNFTDKEINLENEKIIRQFGIPMGMMDNIPEAKIRKDNFIELWKNMKEDEENDPNNERYGVHYSNSMYVSYYMVRTFPFSNIKLEMQGEKFDDPNRLFLRMDISFNNALTQKTDLRELIPELFCFPEMFYNSNNLNLGEISEKLDEDLEEKKEKESNSNDKLVNDVGLPLWADDNGYVFIKKHREFLESSIISEKINEWFNIIFGSKQKGPAAKKINNLFLEQTYEDYEEKYHKNSLEEKINANRMVEFGVTPNQIFKNDTNKRKSYSEHKYMKQLLYNTVSANKNSLIFDEIDCNFDNEKPLRIYEYQKQGYKKWRLFILTKDNVKIYARCIEKVENEQTNTENKETNNNKDNPLLALKNKDTIILNIRKKDDISLPKYKYKLNNEKINNDCSVIFGHGKYIALGGYYNGNIVIKSLDYKLKDKETSKTVYIYSTNENSPITKIIIDNSGTYAICANKLGTIFVFIISPERKFVWILSKVLIFQKNEITALTICENLNIFISCSKDGNCMIYSLPRIKLINSFNIQNPENEIDLNETIYCLFILVYHAPLPCFIFYIKGLNILLVYSINGKFLKKHILEYEIRENGIAKYIDSQMKDFLMIYNSKEKTIDIYRAIDFELVTKSSVINYNFIGFIINEELDHALILVENNNNEGKNNENQNVESKYKILVLKDKENELYWK